jgi:hypothetical protein
MRDAVVLEVERDAATLEVRLGETEVLVVDAERDVPEPDAVLVVGRRLLQR